MDQELLKAVRDEIGKVLGDGELIQFQQKLTKQVNDKQRKEIVAALVDEVKKSVETKLNILADQMKTENDQERQTMVDAFKQAIKEAWTVKLPVITVPKPEVTVNVPALKIPEIKLPTITVPQANVKVELPKSMELSGFAAFASSVLNYLSKPFSIFDEVDRQNPIPVVLVKADGSYLENFGGGSGVVAVGGGPMIEPEGVPVGYRQVSVSTVAVGLGTIPTGANRALITVETDNIRWRDDSTPPTATVGMFVQQTQAFELSGPASISQFKAIRDTNATSDVILNINFYKQ